jgi:hypothetical protein
LEAIPELVIKIWDLRAVPEEWQMNVICPIHKKGDQLKYENHRGFSLLSTAYKLFTT